MSGQHTQGRLYTVEKHGIAYLLKHGATVRGNVVDTKDVVAANMAPEDARRLAACWNAFDGVPTGDIEAFTEHMAGVRETVAKIGQAHTALEAERDQLRAELDTQIKAMHALFAVVDAKDAELAAARALLTDILAADDEARASLQVLGIGLAPHESEAVALTERIRALLGPA